LVELTKAVSFDTFSGLEKLITSIATFPRFKYFPKSSNSCTDSDKGCPTKTIIRGFNYLFMRCLRDSAEIFIAAKNCENPSAKFWLIVFNAY
jgi:hypothetical protein